MIVGENKFDVSIDIPPHLGDVLKDWAYISHFTLDLMLVKILKSADLDENRRIISHLTKVLFLINMKIELTSKKNRFNRAEISICSIISYKNTVTVIRGL